MIGILYLENNLLAQAFTPGRLQVLSILATQAAISLEHAQIYETLEQRVGERTSNWTRRAFAPKRRPRPSRCSWRP